MAVLAGAPGARGEGVASKKYGASTRVDLGEAQRRGKPWR